MIVAVCAAAIGYGVMSLLMTATPISMHTHAGHSLESTKFVIQSHIAAMYLPSLLYAGLFSRLGFAGMLGLGFTLYLLCLALAARDTDFLNYWSALVLLGIGWNFLFLSGTNLLPYGYRPHERFRVQSANDFLVFSVQATCFTRFRLAPVPLAMAGYHLCVPPLRARIYCAVDSVAQD